MTDARDQASVDCICNWGVVGGVIVGLRKREDEALRIELAKLQSEKEAQADKEEWIKNAEEKLREAFDSLAGKSLRHNADAFLKQAQTQMTNVLNGVRGDWKTQKLEMQNLMSPVRENLDKLDGHVWSLEEKREGAYQALDQQLKGLVAAHNRNFRPRPSRCLRLSNRLLSAGNGARCSCIAWWNWRAWNGVWLLRNRYQVTVAVRIWLCICLVGESCQ